jgi:hypothetical protein
MKFGVAAGVLALVAVVSCGSEDRDFGNGPGPGGEASSAAQGGDGTGGSVSEGGSAGESPQMVGGAGSAGESPQMVGGAGSAGEPPQMVGGGGEGGEQSGGSGGATAGSASGGGGGAAGTAGSAAGGTSAGSGGAAGSGGGGAITVADLVGKLDGFLFVAPCGDGGTGYDCLNSAAVPAPQNSPACQNQQQKNTTIDFPIGGETGKIYDVTVHVYGVVEAKNYQGGTRRDGNNMNASATGGDFWYTGGTAPNSTYNTFEFHVTPKVDGAANDYFLNSRNGSNEGHETWALNYTATFPVTGGGKLNFRIYDSNCRQLMNCGPGTGSSTCTAPRQLDLSATDPKPPASFTQPFVGGAPNNATGQWVFIDVTAVAPKP